MAVCVCVCVCGQVVGKFLQLYPTFMSCLTWLRSGGAVRQYCTLLVSAAPFYEYCVPAPRRVDLFSWILEVAFTDAAGFPAPVNGGGGGSSSSAGAGASSSSSASGASATVAPVQSPVIEAPLSRRTRLLLCQSLLANSQTGDAIHMANQLAADLGLELPTGADESFPLDMLAAAAADMKCSDALAAVGESAASRVAGVVYAHGTARSVDADELTDKAELLITYAECMTMQSGDHHIPLLCYQIALGLLGVVTNRLPTDAYPPALVSGDGSQRHGCGLAGSSSRVRFCGAAWSRYLLFGAVTLWGAAGDLIGEGAQWHRPRPWLCRGGRAGVGDVPGGAPHPCTVPRPSPPQHRMYADVAGR